VGLQYVDRSAMIEGLADLLKARVPKERPVLVASAIWPLARALRQPPDMLSSDLIDLLIDHVGPQGHVVMPTLVRGYRDGFCDLDTEPATTGIAAEIFRRRPGVRRSRCVYSSYAVAGPDSAQFALLQPKEVWGEGSHLEWMEQRDATCLMIGTHPTHCIYLHRMELLAADLIPYRYRKTISGRVRHEGALYDISETLFVRVLEPEVQQDFTRLLPALLDGGMRLDKLADTPIASMSAADMRAAVLPILRRDPLAVIANRADFEGKKPLR
jgi:aminoglycoside N3'-acetyltransferase